MKITTKMIDAAYRAGACKAAINWLREKPRTMSELAGHLDWVLWATIYIPTALPVGNYTSPDGRGKLIVSATGRNETVEIGHTLLLLVRGTGVAWVTGSGDGHSILWSDGNGDAIREGSGFGHAWRLGQGSGHAIRTGQGPGHAVCRALGYGDARREGQGIGNAYREGKGGGDAVKYGNIYGAYRSGSGKGHALNYP